MSGNRKVIVFSITFTLIYFGLSFFSKNISSYFPSFKNIDLFADVINQKSIIKKSNPKQKESFIAIPKPAYSQFDNYNLSNQIINFDNNQEVVLTKLSQKLFDLSQNKKVKIRIAWLGDSQIEGDLITKDIRGMLQELFGNQKGVGFLPINCVSSDLRSTSFTKINGSYTDYNFKKQPNKNLFFSGYSYFSPNLNITFKDRTKKDSNQVTEKWLLFGKGDSIEVTQNGNSKKYAANNDFNKILLNKSSSNTVSFDAKFSSTPVYGVSFEPESGIVLDNFSFRGITGVELKSLKNDLLKSMDNQNYYDLIVIQYGVNMMFRANDTNYDYYYKIMDPVLKKLKKQMPNTEFLIFSCSDRAFKYDNEWKSAIGIDSLIKVQARLAYDNKVPFYNLFSSMGGKEVMKKDRKSVV